MNKDDFRNSIRYDINKNNNNHSVRYTAKKNTHNKHRVSNQTRRRISALVAAGLIFLGAYGCSKSTKNPDIGHDTETITVTDVNENEYNKLKNEEAILKDFKERYIKEYNEKNKTKYTSDQVKIYSTTQNFLYETGDGQYVTHGKYPGQTENIIKQYDGTSKGIDGGDLVQVVIDEKVIDACLSGHNNRVLSGNEIDTLLNDLKEKKGNEKSLLSSENLREPLKYCMQIQAGYNENDVKYCIGKYKEIVKNIDEKEKDGFELE